VEVVFSEDGVSVKIPHEKTVKGFQVKCLLRRLEISELGVSLYGNDADLAKIANDLIAGRLDGGALELLKTIGEFEKNRQYILVSEFVKGNFAKLRDTINIMHAYGQFERRGFEYFPRSEQLLLTTYTLVSFEKNGGAYVDYVHFDIENFNEWIAEGRVNFERKYSHTLSERDRDLLKAAEKVVPPQYVKTLQTLQLISEFSRRKQERLLRELRSGPLTEWQIAKLRGDINERYESQARREEYRRLAAEFSRGGLWVNDKEKSILASYAGHFGYGYNKYFLISFENGTTIRDFLQEEQAECKGCKVFIVGIARQLDPHEIIGRWIKTGKVSGSKYVYFKELNRPEILECVDDLKEVAERIDEPYRSSLSDFLVLTKLCAYGRGEQT
jgi:hypothetical protein